MTLAEIVKRHKGKQMPEVLKRTSWDIKKNKTNPEFCYCSHGGNFYLSNDYEELFPFTAEDLAADDWAYFEKVLVIS